MTKFIESFDQSKIKNDDKTQYLRYRFGRLKHQYWLWNRKNKTRALIDEYDSIILKNCRPGKIVFFGSAGYYLKDIWPEIEVVEQFPIVKTFFEDVYICENRTDLPNILPFKADNFAIVNNRAEHWVTVDELTDYISQYTAIMAPGCRFFYSLRDTQLHINRLTIDMEKYFLDWAISLEKLKLKLVWHSIRFDKKVPDHDGNYDYNENPDTINGNLKLMFVFDGTDSDNNWVVNQ